VEIGREASRIKKKLVEAGERDLGDAKRITGDGLGKRSSSGWGRWDSSADVVTRTTIREKVKGKSREKEKGKVIRKREA